MKNNKRWVLVILAVAVFLNGAISQYLSPGAAFSRSDIPFMLLGVTLAFMWYYFDSEQIRYRRTLLLNIGVIAITLLALPYYFFRSRGFKQGLLYTVLFLLVAITWSILQIVGASVVYYGIQH